mmetsp:Transcript_14587/g.34282  ORF Transcript_14587/g.34282 Transcript_14587/m.34282 type:complete len:208 (+) Transcript_14587:257-880(+)
MHSSYDVVLFCERGQADILRLLGLARFQGSSRQKARVAFNCLYAFGFMNTQARAQQHTVQCLLRLCLCFADIDASAAERGAGQSHASSAHSRRTMDDSRCSRTDNDVYELFKSLWRRYGKVHQREPMVLQSSSSRQLWDTRRSVVFRWIEQSHDRTNASVMQSPQLSGSDRGPFLRAAVIPDVPTRTLHARKKRYSVFRTPSKPLIL